MLKCTVLQHWLNIVDQMSCATDVATPCALNIYHGGNTVYCMLLSNACLWKDTCTVYSNMMYNTVSYISIWYVVWEWVSNYGCYNV